MGQVVSIQGETRSIHVSHTTSWPSTQATHSCCSNRSGGGGARPTPSSLTDSWLRNLCLVRFVGVLRGGAVMVASNSAPIIWHNSISVCATFAMRYVCIRGSMHGN